MTDDLEDSGHWRDSGETRLLKLEFTVGEQARLRAAMDKDLSKLHVERKFGCFPTVRHLTVCSGMTGESEGRIAQWSTWPGS